MTSFSSCVTCAGPAIPSRASMRPIAAANSSHQLRSVLSTRAMHATVRRSVFKHHPAGRPSSRSTRINSSPSEDEIAEMRKVAEGQLEPSSDVKIQAIVDLTKQEWGLHGVEFNEVLGMINGAYTELPVEFRTGAGTPDEVINPPGTNSGSRKVYYMAKIHGLSEEETLRLFCEHYEGVKADPDGDAHANIRAFMKHGWAGIEFDGPGLKPKQAGDATVTEGI